MGYQNSSWDICDLTKKVSGPKKFLGPGPGARKVGPPENLSISKFGFFDFEPKLEAKNQGYDSVMSYCCKIYALMVQIKKI